MRKTKVLFITFLFTISVYSGIFFVNAHGSINNSSAKPFISLPNVSWPHANWSLPSSEYGLYNQAFPEYNLQLAINDKLPRETFNTWKIPPTWKRFLYKFRKSIEYLSINLQGTVFLTAHQHGLGVSPATDIPVNATIVAEYVPLRKAVFSGIVPYYGQSLINTPLPKIWMEVLEISNPNFHAW